jgi:hypothetical protein
MRKKETIIKVKIECAREYGRQVWLYDVESIYYYLLVAKSILCIRYQICVKSKDST